MLTSKLSNDKYFEILELVHSDLSKDYPQLFNEQTNKGSTKRNRPRRLAVPNINDDDDEDSQTPQSTSENRGETGSIFGMPWRRRLPIPERQGSTTDDVPGKGETRRRLGLSWKRRSPSPGRQGSTTDDVPGETRRRLGLSWKRRSPSTGRQGSTADNVPDRGDVDASHGDSTDASTQETNTSPAKGKKAKSPSRLASWQKGFKSWRQDKELRAYGIGLDDDERDGDNILGLRKLKLIIKKFGMKDIEETLIKNLEYKSIYSFKERGDYSIDESTNEIVISGDFIRLCQPFGIDEITIQNFFNQIENAIKWEKDISDKKKNIQEDISGKWRAAKGIKDQISKEVADELNITSNLDSSGHLIELINNSNLGIYTAYFNQAGYDTILNFKDIIEDDSLDINGKIKRVMKDIAYILVSIDQSDEIDELLVPFNRPILNDDSNITDQNRGEINKIEKKFLIRFKILLTNIEKDIKKYDEYQKRNDDLNRRFNDSINKPLNAIGRTGKSGISGLTSGISEIKKEREERKKREKEIREEKERLQKIENKRLREIEKQKTVNEGRKKVLSSLINFFTDFDVPENIAFQYAGYLYDNGYRNKKQLEELPEQRLFSIIENIEGIDQGSVEYIIRKINNNKREKYIDEMKKDPLFILLKENDLDMLYEYLKYEGVTAPDLINRRTDPDFLITNMPASPHIKEKFKRVFASSAKSQLQRSPHGIVDSPSSLIDDGESRRRGGIQRTPVNRTRVRYPSSSDSDLDDFSRARGNIQRTPVNRRRVRYPSSSDETISDSDLDDFSRARGNTQRTPVNRRRGTANQRRNISRRDVPSQQQQRPSQQQQRPRQNNTTTPSGILRKDNLVRVRTEPVVLGKNGIGAKSVVHETPIKLTQEWLSMKLELDQKRNSLINITFKSKMNDYKSVESKYKSLSRFYNKQEKIRNIKSLINEIEGGQKTQVIGKLEDLNNLKNDFDEIIRGYSNLLNEGLYKKIEISGGSNGNQQFRTKELSKKYILEVKVSIKKLTEQLKIVDQYINNYQSILNEIKSRYNTSDDKNIELSKLQKNLEERRNSKLFNRQYEDDCIDLNKQSQYISSWKLGSDLKEKLQLEREKCTEYKKEKEEKQRKERREKIEKERKGRKEKDDKIKKEREEKSKKEREKRNMEDNYKKLERDLKQKYNQKPSPQQQPSRQVTPQQNQQVKPNQPQQVKPNQPQQNQQVKPNQPKGKALTPKKILGKTKKPTIPGQKPKLVLQKPTIPGQKPKLVLQKPTIPVPPKNKPLFIKDKNNNFKLIKPEDKNMKKIESIIDNDKKLKLIKDTNIMDIDDEELKDVDVVVEGVTDIESTYTELLDEYYNYKKIVKKNEIQGISELLKKESVIEQLKNIIIRLKSNLEKFKGACQQKVVNIEEEKDKEIKDKTKEFKEVFDYLRELFKGEIKSQLETTKNNIKILKAEKSLEQEKVRFLEDKKSTKKQSTKKQSTKKRSTRKRGSTREKGSRRKKGNTRKKSNKQKKGSK